MKKYTKTNFSRTSSLSISDSDGAKVFDTPNHAIHWLTLTGLVDVAYPSFDHGLFVNAYKSWENVNANGDTEYAIYSIFNFGKRGAIYIKEFVRYGDCSGWVCTGQRFMTENEADKLHPIDF